MINEDILGGLKSATERGESLKKAMMTFYNAGYKKEEIEEAAIALNNPSVSNSPQQTTSTNDKTSVKPSNKKDIKNLEKDNLEKKNSKKIKQKVSQYGKEKKDTNLVFILVGVLVFLLGVLVSIFLFKEQLINFFSSFFG